MVTYSKTTNIGDREVNEDSLGIAANQDSLLFVVCDGLGGHGRGEVASTIVTESLTKQFMEAKTLESYLPSAIQKAQDLLLEEQKKSNAKNEMKTTMTALLLATDKTVIAHIGDSRVYTFNKNRVKTRTRDHSIPQMLVMTGAIKEKEIRHHPERNMLLRVMGNEWEENKFEISELAEQEECQAFLLCSDGFWELIEEKQMCKLLKKSKTVEEWLEAMKEIVEKNGMNKDMDNYTAIAVWC